VKLSEKAKIYYNVWCCAYQRRYIYRDDPERYQREHETLLMCLKIAKWNKFDTEKPKHLK
jgi:hypothetical protein